MRHRSFGESKTPPAQVSRTRTRSRIPPRLIHFWHDSTSIPPHVQGAIDRAVSLHPDYEHVLADDASMVELLRARYGQRELTLYERNAIAASRSDVARLVLLVEYGGFYVDAARILRMPLDTLVEPDTEIFLTMFFGSPANTIMGAIPRHPVVEDTLRVVLRNLERRRYNHQVIKATGADCLATTLERHEPVAHVSRAELSRVNVRKATASNGEAEATACWWMEQVSGIRRDLSSDDPPPLTDDADGSTLAAALEEEAEYLDTQPLDVWGRTWLPPAVRRAFNAWLTDDESTTWLDHLAQRGTYPHVAILTFGATPIDLAFLKSVGATKVTIVSPRSRLLRFAAARIAEGAPELTVETVEGTFEEVALPVGSFDLVLSQFCMHRVRRVERLVGAIGRSLRAGGSFAFFEYVGEDRFQFSPHRLTLAQALLDSLVKGSDTGRGPVPPVSPPAPTEFGPLGAVSSSRILPAARAFLEERHLRTCLAAALPIVLMGHNGLISRVSEVLPHESALLASGESGTIAYGVFGSPCGSAAQT